MGKLIQRNHVRPAGALLATVLIAVFALFAGAAHAQVRKCTGPDGKVVYSDFVCAGNTVKEGGISSSTNSVDATGLREESKKIRGDKAVEAALMNNAQECSFPSSSRDEKSKALAAGAKDECLANIAAKATGGTTSKEAYAAWKEYQDMAVGRRNSGAEAAAVGGKTVNCVPNGSGGMRCR